MDKPEEGSIEQTTVKPENVVDNYLKGQMTDETMVTKHVGVKELNVLSLNSTTLGNVNDKPYKCYNCKVTYCVDDELRTHMLIHTVENPFQCNICCECFSNIFLLKKHILDEHLFKKSEIHHDRPKDADASVAAPAVDDVNQTVEDNGFEKTLSNQNSLSASVEKEHVIKMECQEADFDEASGQDLPMRDESSDKDDCNQSKSASMNNENVVCEVCNKRFKHQYQLTTHSRVHHDEKPFRSRLRNKSYERKAELIEHAITHTKLKPFSCKDCEKSFQFRSGLNGHMKRYHSNKISNAHNNVGTAALSESTTEALQSVASDGENAEDGSADLDKAHQCKDCNSSFDKISQLKKHIKAKHPAEGFKCEICGLTYKRKDTLKNHIRKIHVDEDSAANDDDEDGSDEEYRKKSKRRVKKKGKVTCDVCQEYFKFDCELRRHMMHVHNDERPFPCHVCHRRFKARGHLTEHLFLHSGVKPFSCNVCGKKFAKRSSLNSHQTTHGLNERLNVANEKDENEIYQNQFENADTRDELTVDDKVLEGDGSANQKQLPALNEDSESTLIKNEHEGDSGEDYDMNATQVVKKREKLTCDICNEHFEFLQQLETHKMRVHNEKPYTCDVCNKGFKQMASLMEHSTMHIELKPFSCTICGHMFDSESGLSLHMKKHELQKRSNDANQISDERNKRSKIEANLTCSICQETFTKRQDYNSHYKVHLQEFKPFHCNKCDESFHSMSELNEHQVVHGHDQRNEGNETEDYMVKLFDPKRELSDANNFGMQSSIDGCAQLYACSVCEKSFHDWEPLKAHVEEHIPYEKKNDASGLDEKSENDDQGNTEEGVKHYKCTLCHKTFGTGRSLKLHVSLHSDERPFKCEVCNRGFRRHAEVLSHLKTHSEYQTLFSCPKCKNAKFMSQGSYDKHMKRHELMKEHEKSAPDKLLDGIRPYQCSVCDWSFKDKNSLHDHQLIHTGEKPYQCDQCGKSFRQKSSFNSHRVTHSAVKPYMCKECNHGCFTKKGMKLHVMKKHTGEKPHQCEYCGKRFVTQYDLGEHVRLHTGERPFECSTCGKAFAKKPLLKDHERIHSDARPYLCSLCGNGFKRSDALKQHMRTHRKK